VGGSVRRVGGDLRDALSEGRQAMQAREAALRDELSQPPR
jgi:hypothetical protein